MHNITRECQSHWRKNFLPYIRCVATIPCESLRHKRNTFHTNNSTSHMFISTTFTETSIDETNKTQQKGRGSKFMLKMSTIHANTCIQTTTPLRNRWWFRWQCPVLVLRSCTSWNQGLRSTVTITRIQFCWICFFFLLLERISLAYHIRSIFGDYYVFQQDGAPAHRPRDTVTMLQRDARV